MARHGQTLLRILRRISSLKGTTLIDKQYAEKELLKSLKVSRLRKALRLRQNKAYAAFCGSVQVFGTSAHVISLIITPKHSAAAKMLVLVDLAGIVASYLPS